MTNAVNGSAERQRRTGDRLRAARERLGLSKSEAARRVGLTRRELAAYEKGRWRVPETTMARLAKTYGLPTGEVVPSRSASRLEVAHDHVAAGEAERMLPDDATPDEVLGEYLDLVRELRGLGEHDQLPLRDADLAVLAEALGGSPERIESRLVELINCTREEAQAIRRALMKRRLVAPAAGFLLGVGTITPAVAGADAPDPATPAADVADATEAVSVGDPADVIDEGEGPPGEEPAEEPADEPGDDARGDDWAEIIDPLVIEKE